MKDRYPRAASRSFLRATLDALPSPVFVVGDDARIVDMNATAGDMLGVDPRTVRGERLGEVLHCVNLKGDYTECGRTPECRVCSLRAAVVDSLGHEDLVRHQARVRIDQPDGEPDTELHVETTSLLVGKRRYAVLVVTGVGGHGPGWGVLAVCAACKRVREGGTHWTPLEDYLAGNHGIKVTHALCPECVERMYGGDGVLAQEAENGA